MGYRDDFYVTGNIFGYTGPIISNPTVYFRKGSESGHITQLHELAANEGREKVLNDPKYEIKNIKDAGGKEVCFEKWPKHGIEHESRSRLETDIKKHHLELLSQSIKNFTELKPIANMTDVQINALQPKPAKRRSVADLVEIHKDLIRKARG